MAAFALTVKEHNRLRAVGRQTDDVRVLRRSQALLGLAGGDTAEEVATRLGMTRQTIYNWIHTFQARVGLDMTQRLSDEPRSGRPRTALGVIDPWIDAVIDHDPHEWGYRATTWTAPLLVEYLSAVHALEVSEPSVKLAVRRLRLRWKRPRQQLALRPATWRQSKGG